MTRKEEAIIQRVVTEAVRAGLHQALAGIRLTTITQAGPGHQVVDSTYQVFEPLNPMVKQPET
jgi:hypothetical protein